MCLFRGKNSDSNGCVSNREVDGNELLEDTDRGEFEDEIEQQAVESGLQMSVERIAEAAMQTESLKN